MDIYRQYLRQPVSDPINIADGIWISRIADLSLEEFIEACIENCSIYHRNNCAKCSRLVNAAHVILQCGICSLSYVFRTVFPDINYTPKQARCRLLQLPLAAIRIGEPSSGCSDIKVMELLPDLDYRKFKKFIGLFIQQSGTTKPSMTKDCFRLLLSFAQSRRERETLTYKASGLSATAAQRHFGLTNIVERANLVEEFIMEAQTIRECIDSLSKTQEKAMLLALGIPAEDSSSEEEFSSESEDGSFSDTGTTTCEYSHPLPSRESILTTLTESKWNWFQFLELMEKYDSIFADRFEGVYEAIISTTDLLPHVQKLLKQSHDAYVCDRNTRLSHDLRVAGALNGMVVADSDDVNPEEFVGVCELTSERVKNLGKERP